MTEFMTGWQNEEESSDTVCCDQGKELQLKVTVIGLQRQKSKNCSIAIFKF